MNISELKVAAFDWDNTLALSHDALIYCVNIVLEEFGLPLWDVVKYKRNKNLSFRDNFPRIFGDKAEAAYSRYRQVYLQYVDNMISAPTYAEETLNLLHDRGVKIVIVSNKDRLLLEHELPLLYKPQIFQNIVCGHEALRDKPYPEQLQFAVTDLVDEINYKKVWMIGDSEMDSSCANACGVTAIRIGLPIWEDKLEPQKDALFFANFSEFYRFLKG